MDDVSINLLPEKKGTVFKHNEYMVESKVRVCVYQWAANTSNCEILVTFL